MPIYLPTRVVRNWYQYDVSFSLELIDSFVDGVEKQAADSIVNYREKRRSEVIGREQNDERLVNTHQGLDDETWDLDGIFEEYFPSLQRRSAFLTVCSYFEHELDSLCSLYQSEKDFKEAPSDEGGKGIDRSANYLARVANLNVHKASEEWAAIKRIQKVRNLIVHQNGKLRDHRGEYSKRGKEVADLVPRISFVSGDSEVVLENGFLRYVLTKYRGYFRLISESITAREGNGTATK